MNRPLFPLAVTRTVALAVSFVVVLAASVAIPLAAQTHTPVTHRLEATPATVAYGYYWSEAKPALRIASGDIIDVDTPLTNTPAGRATSGLADGRGPQSAD